jgi:major membrane immunogen (membrane-anchored lipoprotein)
MLSKISTVLLILCCVLSSCKDTTMNNDIVGTWQLTHQTVDFGPEMGNEIAVSTKDKKITFRSEGTFVCTGNLCVIDDSTIKSTDGSYQKDKQTMNVVPCGPGLGATRYEIKDKDLYLYFVCNGPCVQRYKKISNE